jgi:hypothetical protein
MKTNLNIIAVLLFSFTASCQKGSNKSPTSNSPSVDFAQYWFQGKAELTSYALQQARYGEMREGTAVMIFVTEDFSYEKQVKLDYPSKVKNDAVKVLKLNFTKKFRTGVYPYSMMSSVFTPIDLSSFNNSLKTTTSSQEWCGHTFSQLNYSKGSYDFELRSYFESEGDVNKNIKAAFLEDDVWTRIRINPEKLPIGNFGMIPSGLYTRLSHIEAKAYNAKASLQTTDLEGEKVKVYQLDYIDFEKNLTIYFESKFPYAILKWQETHQSGFGKNAKKMTTIGTRNKSMMLDYWSKNHESDSTYRTTLGLD